MLKMESLRFLLAVIVGVVMFISDLSIGWLTALTGRFPVVIIMGFVIGLIAGRGLYAPLAAVISWVAGIVLSVLITMALYPGQIPPDATIDGLLITAAVMALRGTFDFEYEGPWIIALPVIIVYLVIILIVTPLLYLIGVGAAVVGGLVGHVIEKILQKSLQKPAASPPAPTTAETSS